MLMFLVPHNTGLDDRVPASAWVYGVFLMSSWPNMAFDLCCICCGHFLMPFWTFFGATLLGKAGVKVIMQVPCLLTHLS